MKINMEEQEKLVGQENFLSILLESIYPGLSEYIAATQGVNRQRTSSAELLGTKNLIEETKELIKESQEDFNTNYAENPISDLQSWIENGKELIQKEINNTTTNLEDLYDDVSEINDVINGEEERVGRLEKLLQIISL